MHVWLDKYNNNVYLFFFFNGSCCELVKVAAFLCWNAFISSSSTLFLSSSFFFSSACCFLSASNFACSCRNKHALKHSENTAITAHNTRRYGNSKFAMQLSLTTAMHRSNGNTQCFTGVWCQRGITRTTSPMSGIAISILKRCCHFKVFIRHADLSQYLRVYS